MFNIVVFPNEELTFSWTADNQIAYTFNGLAVNGNYKTIFANENIGKTNYVLSAFNAAGDASDLETISVNVVEFPVINSFNAPSNVIVGSQFTLSWSGTNVVNYKIKSNDVNSGISTSYIDLGTNLSRNITPNDGGTFTYTITATVASPQATGNSVEQGAGMPQIQALSVQSLSNSIVDLNPELIAHGKAAIRNLRERYSFALTLRD